MLKHAQTYEIMTPESVGLRNNSLVLGKHSGKAAYKDRLQALGYECQTEAEIDQIVQRCKVGIVFRFCAFSKLSFVLFVFHVSRNRKSRTRKRS